MNRGVTTRGDDDGVETFQFPLAAAKDLPDEPRF